MCGGRSRRLVSMVYDVWCMVLTLYFFLCTRRLPFPPLWSPSSRLAQRNYFIWRFLRGYARNAFFF
ncbi:hypothetical protein EON63_11670 [archaeon]|nr:MAG: hypothetical protein EON63_11670 [archaeon]